MNRDRSAALMSRNRGASRDWLRDSSFASFLRKQESEAHRPMEGSFPSKALDSRFHGNDGEGRHDHDKDSARYYRRGGLNKCSWGEPV